MTVNFVYSFSKIFLDYSFYVAVLYVYVAAEWNAEAHNDQLPNFHRKSRHRIFRIPFSRMRDRIHS